MNSTIQAGSMHEMLFEKRNKDYGAYVIRNTYSDTVLKSLVMVASALLLFIGGAYAYNNFFAKKSVPVEEFGSQDYVLTDVNLSPLDKKPELPKEVSAPKAATVATVIKEEAEEDPEKKNLPLAPVAGKGDADSTSTDPVIGDPGGTVVAVVTPSVTPIKTPVLIADEMPEYIGGNKAMVEFISRNVVYPERSKLIGMQGTVFVSFVVDTDGKVVSCKIIKGVDEDCNEEALRVVSKMPVWKPGKNAGIPVPVMFNLPIKFRLD